MRKIFDKLSRPKIRELLPQYGRKNLVTTIFFEQRIEEKLKGTVMQIESALLKDSEVIYS